MIANFVKKHPSLSCFLLCYILFSLATAGTEISKIDVRFAFILKDLANQPFNIFPCINGVPYADYFSPFFWFAFLTTGGGKWVNLWSMAQPAMLLASFTLMMTYRIGERMMPKAGLWAVLLLLSSFEFVYSVCQFGIDLPVAALAILMLDQLMQFPDRKRTVLFWMLGLPLAMLFRGSLGLIVFGGAVAGCMLMTGNWKKILLYGLTGAIGAGLGAGLIIGWLFHEGGNTLFRQFLDWQIHKRVAGGDYFYYIIDGFFSFGPGSFLVLAALILKRKELKPGPVLPLLGFLMLPVLVLSIPGGKHLRYLLPLLAAPALAGGYCLAGLPQTYEKWTPAIMKYLRFLPLLGLIAIPCMIITGLCLYPAKTLPWINWIAAGKLFLVLWQYRKKFQTLLGMFAMIVLCSLASFCGIAIPLIGTAENSSRFVHTVERERTGRIFIFAEDPDHDALKYMLWLPPEMRKNVICLQEGYIFRNTDLDRMYRRADAVPQIRLLQPGDILIVKHGSKTRRLQELLKKNGRIGEITASGNLGHRKYNAIRIEK